jgi:hypothetical protein
VPTLKEAARKYNEFIEKASGNATYAEAVKRSKDRAQDIQDTIKFIEEGEKVRVEQEEIDKAAAKAAAEQQQGGQAPPAQGAPAPK